MFFVVDKLVCLRSHETCTICGPRISERELEQFVAQWKRQETEHA